MRRFLCLLILFLSGLKLQAQNLNEERPSGGYIFPLALVLEGAEYAAEGWKPDWPLGIPPDGFKVQTWEVSTCEIKSGDLSLGFKIDRERRVEKFPFMVNGRIAQITLAYTVFSEMREMTVNFPSGEDPWKLEFLEYRNTFPYLVRAYCGNDGGDGDAGLWYFIYFSWGVSEILETWYDENGKALGAYGFTLAEVGEKTRIRTVKDYSDPGGSTELFYDSRGLVTGVSGPAGFFSVLYYREDSPRYWEYRPAAEDEKKAVGNFTFQWDETGLGLLRRLSGGDEGAGVFLDCRYEYTLDERGNWIERRETRMVEDMGLLFPSPGTTFTRVLEYKK
jgi:hypothetical protein